MDLDFAELVRLIVYSTLAWSIGYYWGKGYTKRVLNETQPYSWACEECQEGGLKFELRANDLASFDQLILNHKERSHNGG